MNKTLSERISWVDICRGIAILLVLLGHGLYNDTQRFLIYAFHMPLFFFLSGIVFKPDNKKSFFRVFFKNVRAILVPYVLFAVLTFIASFILLQSQVYTTESFIKQVYGVFYGNGNNGYLAYNVALWFLPCLFLCKVGFAFLTRFIHEKKVLFTALFLFSVIGYIFSVFFHDHKLFFGLETAFSAIVFFGAGYLWNANEKLKATLMTRSAVSLSISLVLLVLFAGLNFHFFGNQIDMRLNRINNYFFFYLAAFSGIIASISISMMIKHNTLLEYFGKYSLLLFVWHTVLYSFFRMYAIPPFKIDFITPIFFVIQASIIIFLGRIVVDKVTKRR